MVKAELVIKPVTGSFGGFYPLPPKLRLSETTQLNELGTDVSTTVTGTSAVEYGDLYIDDLYGQNTGYTYDITSYITTQMAVTANN